MVKQLSGPEGVAFSSMKPHALDLAVGSEAGEGPTEIGLRVDAEGAARGDHAEKRSHTMGPFGAPHEQLPPTSADGSHSRASSETGSGRSFRPLILPLILSARLQAASSETRLGRGPERHFRTRPVFPLDSRNLASTY